MCGIAGAFSPNGNIHSNHIYEMTQAAVHRGPNDEGYLLVQEDSILHLVGNDSPMVLKMDMAEILGVNEMCYLAMGHRRLSIIDLSEQGHQPMSKHGLVLVFNGEIYNYIEIRNILIEHGYDFVSNCDTEVILSAYDFWGKDCVNLFNGMWAIAIYDAKNKIVFCSRDRFGVKPFYYFQDKENFYFASEIKQLLTQISERKLNKSVLMDYIHFLITDFTDDTLFEGIKKLPPSHSLFLSTDSSVTKRFYVERYYDLKNTKINRISHKDFYELFKSSVNVRTRSDVPIGATLSGGLDSSSIVSTLSKQQNNISEINLNTFTFTVPGNLYDETHYANIINNYANANQNFTKLDLDANFYEEYIKLIQFQDEPFQSFSIYASWLVMKLASTQKIPVLLNGQGADEVFLGYQYFLAVYIKEYFRKYGFKKTILVMKLIIKNTNISINQLISLILFFGVPSLRKAIKMCQIKAFVSKPFSENYKISTQLDDYLKMDNIKDLQYTAIHKNLQPLLKWEDQNSMAFSIETRLPFMDFRVVEQAYLADFDELIHKGRLKAIIRSFMEKNLPEEILYRKDKIGFYSPDHLLLNSISKETIDELLNNPRSAELFKMNKISKYFRKKKNFKARYLFFTIETWMRKNDIKVTL